MHTFQIKSHFLLDNHPFKIYSGAIHYFRIHPIDWRHSLQNLKNLGFNTVETYIPWNLHEPKKGKFDFSGGLDLEKFIETAAEAGLYVILRPSPFICAEWEWGGLPAWLLNEPGKPRSRDPRFLAHVQNYYDELFKRIVPHQLDHGGNILMFQVENEYGSFAQDKEYLRAIAKMMRKGGLTMPFFTSDGPWKACLRAGSLIEDDILPTGNFGSRANMNFDAMEEFFHEHGKEYPLMCMEFWDGWFNRYNEPIHKRDANELANAVCETMKRGSINLYMFHGGTNFGFMNGCSARDQHDLPQITSYDYGALLDEQGNPTDKYYAVQKMIQKEFPDLKTQEPLIKESMAIENIPQTDRVSLFETLDTLANPIESLDPLTMEEAGQNVGYILYRTELAKDADELKLRIIDGRDRAQLYLDGRLEATQYQEEIGDPIFVHPKQEVSQLDVLVENMGRVNYGSKFRADTQRKGLRQGVMSDLHFIQNWKQYPLPLDNIEKIDFSRKWKAGQPGFYRYQFDVLTPKDTFIDTRKMGKGAAWVNGFHIGRFWQTSPMGTLYIPHGLLKEGKNEIIILDTEQEAPAAINLVAHPIEVEMENKIHGD